jgi:hypothetical protein
MALVSGDRVLDACSRTEQACGEHAATQAVMFVFGHDAVDATAADTAAALATAPFCHAKPYTSTGRK